MEAPASSGGHRGGVDASHHSRLAAQLKDQEQQQTPHHLLPALEDEPPVLLSLGHALAKCCTTEQVLGPIASTARLLFPSAAFLSVELPVLPQVLLSIQNLVQEGQCNLFFLHERNTLAGACYVRRACASSCAGMASRCKSLLDVEVEAKQWGTDRHVCLPIPLDSQQRMLAAIEAMPHSADGDGNPERRAAQVLEAYQATCRAMPCIGVVSLGLPRGGSPSARELANLALVATAMGPYLAADWQSFLEIASSSMTRHSLRVHAVGPPNGKPPVPTPAAATAAAAPGPAAPAAAADALRACAGTGPRAAAAAAADHIIAAVVAAQQQHQRQQQQQQQLQQHARSAGTTAHSSDYAAATGGGGGGFSSESCTDDDGDGGSDGDSYYGHSDGMDDDGDVGAPMTASGQTFRSGDDGASSGSGDSDSDSEVGDTYDTGYDSEFADSMVTDAGFDGRNNYSNDTALFADGADSRAPSISAGNAVPARQQQHQLQHQQQQLEGSGDASDDAAAAMDVDGGAQEDAAETDGTAGARCSDGVATFGRFRRKDSDDDDGFDGNDASGGGGGGSGGRGAPSTSVSHSYGTNMQGESSSCGGSRSGNGSSGATQRSADGSMASTAAAAAAVAASSKPSSSVDAGAPSASLSAAGVTDEASGAGDAPSGAGKGGSSKSLQAEASEAAATAVDAAEAAATAAAVPAPAMVRRGFGLLSRYADRRLEERFRVYFARQYRANDMLLTAVQLLPLVMLLTLCPGPQVWPLAALALASAAMFVALPLVARPWYERHRDLVCAARALLHIACSQSCIAAALATGGSAAGLGDAGAPADGAGGTGGSVPLAAAAGGLSLLLTASGAASLLFFGMLPLRPAPLLLAAAAQLAVTANTLPALCASAPIRDLLLGGHGGAVEGAASAATAASAACLGGACVGGGGGIGGAPAFVAWCGLRVVAVLAACGALPAAALSLMCERSLRAAFQERELPQLLLEQQQQQQQQAAGGRSPRAAAALAGSSTGGAAYEGLRRRVHASVVEG